MKRNAYYWPGIHRLDHELHHLFELMETNLQITTYRMRVPFDRASENSTSLYCYIVENLKTVASEPCKIWIGLSYGASLGYFMLPRVPEELRPKYCIVVNPFSRRAELAQYKGFTYPREWDINPAEVPLVPGVKSLLVISKQDTHIPYEFKTGIIDNFQRIGNRTVFLDAGHALESLKEQELLYTEVRDFISE